MYKNFSNIVGNGLDRSERKRGFRVMKTKKLLSTLLAMAITISSFAALPITASAETTKKTMNFGSSVISVRDNIYYGNQKKWRVLSTNGNTTQNEGITETATYTDDNGNKIEGPLFVISENDFGKRAFDPKNNQNWQGSKARNWCNGEFYTKAGITTDIEKAAILQTSKSDTEYLNYKAADKILENDKVFYLSAKEAVTYFNDNNDRRFGGDAVWWLRSPNSDRTDYVGAVKENGIIVHMDAPLDYVASRPAFNLNPESVLFTSAVDYTGGAVENYSGNEWKLTLKDESRNGFKASNTGIDGNKIQISYSGAKTGNNEKISYIITDKDQKEIKYYGNRAATSESGSVNITLPTIADSDRLFVFNEQDNGEKKTNYASEPVEVISEYCALDVYAGAYIDTGIFPTSKTRVVMDAEVSTSENTRKVFGVWSESEGSNFEVNCTPNHFGSGFGSKSDWVTDFASGRHRIELDRNVFKLDGVTKYTFTDVADFESAYKMYLFAINFYGTEVQMEDGQHIRFYSCKVYENDALVHEFVPAKWLNTPGVCDMQNNNKFYAMQGTGTVSCLNGNLIEGKKPTCTDTGLKQYYQFDGKYYKDEVCRQLITDLENWKITPEENGGGMLPKLAHNWTEAEENKAGESTLKTAATCTANAFYHKVCADCGSINENETWEKPNTAGHHWENAEQNKAGKSTLKTAATCVSDAVYHKACTDCDAINKNETWEKPNTATGIHSWVTINGTEHKCSVCDATGEHSYQDGECTDCGRNENYGKYIVRSLNELTKKIDESKTDVPDTVIEITEDRTTLPGGWYIVAENVEIKSRISVTGTTEKPTNIIIMDDCTLTVKGGINVAGNNTLNIYGQKNDTGTLLVSNVAEYNAGIGGTDIGKAGGTVTVYGGIVTATGGNYGAGIGSGGGSGAAGNVTIYGGTVTATGGDSAAGIGAGHDFTPQVKKDHGTLSVSNGNLTVKAGNSANDAEERTVQQYITDRNRYVYIGEKYKLSLEVDGNKFTVTPSGENTEIGTVVVALYDSTNTTRLIEAKVFDDTAKPIKGTFSQSGYVKAFWWSDLVDMIPLCDAKGENMEVEAE